MKHSKRFTALVLALVMVFSLTTGASAAATENVKVQLSPNITVTYNGEPQTMADINGNPVYPILNGGTTYLPIRAVGNMLGLDVDWDGATQTVLLNKSTDGEATPAKSGNASASDSAPTEITAQINPGITVKYNGKTPNMADVNGNPVYPILYGGTTYLPVRAVSNMLGIAVDWDGATQTVILTEPNANDTNTAQTPILMPDASADGVSMIVTDRDGREVTVEVPYDSTQDEIVAILTAANVDEELAKVMAGSHRFTSPEESDKINHVAEMKTSADAKILGENHVGYDWCEIDWSNADDGYIRIKINEQTTSHTVCQVNWYEDEIEGQGDRHNKTDSYAIPEGRWVNVPLIGDATDFAVTIEQGWTADELEAELEAATANMRPRLIARFTGKTISENTRWLLSTAYIDFENAPLTCAKAQEITKNCKTDAEKITAVFNWVASNVTYDQELYNREKAERTNGVSPIVLEYIRDFSLDHILNDKKGVCEHYAVLMAGMLRSLGIPCKVVHGSVYHGRIDPVMSPNGWEGHAWVAVNPQSGELNMKSLGAGKDFEPTKVGEMDNENPTGWIRLDPTWGDTASGRADAAIDENHRTTDCD